MKRFYINILLLSLSACARQTKVDRQHLAQQKYKSALLELSEEKLTVQQYKQALNEIEQAIAYHAKPEYLALQGTILFSLGHEAESQECYRQALLLKPGASLEAEILNNQACLFAAQHKGDQAVSIWKKLEKNYHYKTPEVALVNRGKLLLSEQKPQEALKLFKQAVNLAPHYLDAHFYIALTAQRTGDFKLLEETRELLKSLDAPQESLALIVT